MWFFDIMYQLRKSLINKIDDNFCGMNMKKAILNNYLSLSEIYKFARGASTVYRIAIDYSRKWFSSTGWHTVTSLHYQYTTLTATNTRRYPWQIYTHTTQRKGSDRSLSLRFINTGRFLQIRLCNMKHSWCAVWILWKRERRIFWNFFKWMLSISVSNTTVERIFIAMINIFVRRT